MEIRVPLMRRMYMAVCAYVLFGPAGYGAIAPPCGKTLAVYKGVAVKSNDKYQWGLNGGGSCGGRGDFGLQFQCVEYVKRFYYEALGITRALNWTGNAEDFFFSADKDQVNPFGQVVNNKGLLAFSNGNATPPEPDDMLVFGSTDKLGHIAIITSVTASEVTFVEQNWSITGTSTLPLSVSTTGYKIHDRVSTSHSGQTHLYTVLGWLRDPDRQQSCPPSFTDDFNRLDGPVGNGWTNTTGNTDGDLVISNGALAGTPGRAAIYRPVDLSSLVTASATITQENGFGGSGRYVGFLFGNNGSVLSGYGVFFGRDPQNTGELLVELILNGTQLLASSAATPDSFQFGPSITVSVTFAPDGSITGSVIGNGVVFTFDLGVVSRASLPGSNIAVYTQGAADGGSNPVVDNVTISHFCNIVPE